MRHRVTWKDNVGHRVGKFVYTFTFPNLTSAMDFALALYESVEVDRDSVCISVANPFNKHE